MNQRRKEDLHNQIVQLYRGGYSKRGIARQLDISHHQVSCVLATHQSDRDQGSQTSLPRPKRKRASRLDEYEASLAQLLARYPNITEIGRAHV